MRPTWPSSHHSHDFHLAVLVAVVHYIKVSSQKKQRSWPDLTFMIFQTKDDGYCDGDYKGGGDEDGYGDDDQGQAADNDGDLLLAAMVSAIVLAEPRS